MRKRLTLQAIERAEEYAKNSSGERHSTVFGIVHPDGRHLHSIECIDGEWVRTDKPVTIYTAEKLERAVTTRKRFVIIYGGRGSMKSVGAVDICLAGVMDRGDKVFCLREFQSSIAESVHALIKEEIYRLNLEHFAVLDTTIRYKYGGEFKYMGLARNPASIKSAAGFRRFLTEEAATLSDASITNLTPTARNKARSGLPGMAVEESKSAIDDVQMFFIANINSSEDPFSKRFINPFLDHLNRDGYYEDDLHLIIKMNYTDNPWFMDSGLEGERLFDLENKPRAVYDHIWMGAPLDTVENSIILAEWFDACVDAHIKLGFEPTGQERLAYDPADSGDAKAVGYQHGSVVTGVSSTNAGDVNSATDWALGFAVKLKPDVFLWDSDGIGLSLRRQVMEGLKGKKVKIVPFHGGEAVQHPNEIYDGIEGEGFFDIERGRTNSAMFLNLRAQNYWRLRDKMFKTYLAVEKGKYFPPDELISFSSGIKELVGLRAEICRIPRKYSNSNGKIQILSKPEMKAKKIKSPNMADVVMMLQQEVDIYDNDDYDDYDDSEPDQGNGGWA
jgi:phage terminase large subunit